MMFNQPPPSPLSPCSPQGPPAPSLAPAVPGILQPPRVLTIQALAAAAMANRHPSDDWVCQVCGNFNRAVRERCNMNVCAAPFGFPGPYKWIAPSTTSTSPARPQHHFNNTTAPATTTTTATTTNVPMTTTVVPMPTHTGASGSGLTHTGVSGPGLTHTGVSGSGLTTGTGSSSGGFMTPSCGHSPPLALTPSTSRTSAHTVAATTATAAAAAAAAFVATPNTAASTPHSTTAPATMMNSGPTAMGSTTSPLTFSTSTDPAAFPSAGAGLGAGVGAGARNTPPMLSPWGRQDASGSWNSAPVKAEASLDDRFSLSAKSGAPPSTSSEPAQPAQPLTQPLSSNSTATPVASSVVSSVLPPPAVKATSTPGAPEGWVYVPAHTLQQQGVVPLPACTSLPQFTPQQSMAPAPVSSTSVTTAANPASAQPYMMVHPSHMVYLVPQPQQQ